MENVEVMIPTSYGSSDFSGGGGNVVEMASVGDRGGSEETRALSGTSKAKSISFGGDECDDEECRCGRRVCCCCWCKRDREKHRGWCPCCCCCKVRTKHVFEISVLSILLSAICLSVMTIPPTFLVVGMARSVILGFPLMMLLMCYIPIFTFSCWYVRSGRADDFTTTSKRVMGTTAAYFVGSRQPSSWKGGRFRSVANLLYAFCSIIICTFCVFVLLPEAYDLDSKMSTLGATTDTPFASVPPTHSFGDWLFKGSSFPPLFSSTSLNTLKC